MQITERGTEAAAATSAFIFRMSPGKVMQFDRPFFLFIYDALNKVHNILYKTLEKLATIVIIQVVIFWARVVEPTPIEVEI